MSEPTLNYSQRTPRIATPFSTGTGCLLTAPGLVVTTEHLVRDNREVSVTFGRRDRITAAVVYLDSYHDLAFLRCTVAPDPARGLVLAERPARTGEEVLALACTTGKECRWARGMITDPEHEFHELNYLEHNALLPPGDSGGPLLDEAGRLLGINVFDLRDRAEHALAIPAATVRQCLNDFMAGGGLPAARCFNCRRVVFERPGQAVQTDCPHCQSPVMLPGNVEEYEASGVQAGIEELIEASGHSVRLARRGPNHWDIEQGSARILISYHEESGLVTGDAHLCRLPQNLEKRARINEFLLLQNFTLDTLGFSTHDDEVILSLLIYDRYFSVETALPRFQRLFQTADDYDDVLVEAYGARWR